MNHVMLALCCWSAEVAASAVDLPVSSLCSWGDTMRLASRLMGFVFCVASFGVSGEPGTEKAQADERAQRIPVLVLTDEIQVSSNSSDSWAYVVIRPSGQLVYVPYRSAKLRLPEGSQSTASATVEFAYWYATLASRSVLEKTSQDDRLVYFMGLQRGVATAVFIPAKDAALLEPLFNPFLKPSKTPP